MMESAYWREPRHQPLRTYIIEAIYANTVPWLDSESLKTGDQLPDLGSEPSQRKESRCVGWIDQDLFDD